MEEEALSQGMQWPLGGGKGKGTESFLELLDGLRPC